MLEEQRAWASNTLQDSSAGRAEVAALQAQAQHLTQASSDDGPCHLRAQAVYKDQAWLIATSSSPTT